MNSFIPVITLLLTIWTCHSTAFRPEQPAVESTTTPSPFQENKICVDRVQRTPRKHLGCFKDRINQRMFLGFVVLTRENTIDKCIQVCYERRFVYAGLQNGEWCHCGNSAPNTSLNKELPASSCNKPCSGDSTQTCGGPYIMDVYETGVEVYRFDKTGKAIGESVINADEIVIKPDITGVYNYKPLTSAINL